MSLDLVKTKGVNHFVNILKTQDKFQLSLLRFFKRLTKYPHWCDKIGTDSNLMSYLLRNTNKIDDEECMQVFTDIIRNLSKSEVCVRALLEEIDIQTLGATIDKVRKKQQQILTCLCYRLPLA